MRKWLVLQGARPGPRLVEMTWTQFGVWSQPHNGGDEIIEVWVRG